MDDWKHKILGRAIWIIRHRIQKKKSGQRIEICFSGEPDLTLLLTSNTPITASMESTIYPIIDIDWIDTNSTEAKGVPSDNDEITTLFHKLWSNAGTTEYDKKDWKRLAKALSNSGYKL